MFIFNNIKLNKNDRRYTNVIKSLIFKSLITIHTLIILGNYVVFI